MEQGSRELDVIVHGASGFVGRLVAEHLARHAPAQVRVGLSGRSKDRLEAVREGLGERAQAWPVVVADAHDDAALAELVSRTRVVASTVGPYERFGLPLTRACAAAGTDYVDLTAEVLFMRASIDGNDDLARETGARLVHGCGFDSVPSDLGVLLLASTAAAHSLGELTDTRLVLRGARGGFSGGTIDSLRAQLERTRGDRAARAVLADPYALSPDRAREPDRTVDGPGDGADPRGVAWDEDAGRWLAPFVMGPVNSRVVRRSNALSGYSYGRGFTYREAVGVPGRVLGAAGAGAVAVGTGAFAAAMNLRPTRGLLDRVLPAVGTGPDESTRESGYFDVRLHARTSTDRRLQVKVSATGDPGYAATALMLGESALTLVLDRERLPEALGVLTPATGLGGALVDRLRAAGMTLHAF